MEINRNNIILKQNVFINRLRSEMTPFLNLKKDHIRALFVGEGVLWSSTFLGFCIINDCLPLNIEEIIIIDLNYSGELNFSHQLNFEGFEKLKIDSVTGDATAMPFDEDQFDLIVAPFMIDDCFDHLKLLNEFKRCIIKGGTIILSGHGLDSHSKYKSIPKLIGSNHINQTTVKQINKLLKECDAQITNSYVNEHCWFKVFHF